MELYLDYAATTPLDERVLAAMLPFFTKVYGNPSSLHRPGQAARKAVETAREQVAAALGAHPKEILFTSGATEADNQAVRAGAARRPGGHIVTSRLEHAAVLSTCRVLETQGHKVTYLPPDERGEITVRQVADALRADTVLVALMPSTTRPACAPTSPPSATCCRAPTPSSFATPCRRSGSKRST